LARIFNKAGLLFFMVILIIVLGASYAGYIAVLKTHTSLSTGNMDFNFDDSNEDFSISIQKGKDGEIRRIGAIAEYDGKNLIIKDMDPIDTTYLDNVDLRFIIRYRIKPSENSSLMKAAEFTEIKNDEEEYVKLRRTGKTIQWVGNMDRNSEGKTGGVTASNIQNLMPDSLGNFRVTKKLEADDNEKMMQGTILLEQVGFSDGAWPKSIDISSLGASVNDLEIGMEAGTNEITLRGFYGFEIPFVLDQFNCKLISRRGLPLWNGEKR
jgi:hypothetical protein